MGAFDTIGERLRQARIARTEAAAVNAPTPGAGAVAAIGTILAGDTVFDIRSGVVGVVTASTVADPTQPATLEISLHDGRSVSRSASEVIVRPTAPTVY